MRFVRPPIPVEIPKKILERLIKAGKSFFHTLINGEDVKNRAPMDTKNGTADEMMELNKVLLEYRSKVSKEASELEESIAGLCKERFDAIVDTLEFANSDFQFYRVETLKRKLDHFLEEIDGYFGQNISKRISLDDMECINILKMLPGDLKGQRMAELKKKVIQESIGSLCKKVRDFENDFFEGMELSVDSRLEGLEDRIREKRAAFETLEKSNEDTSASKEEVVLNAAYIFSIAGMYTKLEESEE